MSRARSESRSPSQAPRDSASALQAVKAVRAVRAIRIIRAAERDVIDRYPFLSHTDAIALSVSIAASSTMVLSMTLYAFGRLPAPLVVVLNALCASMLHEIEHDLIHRVYFRTRKWLYHATMALVWVLRGNLVHGWYRRRMHLHHHRASGSGGDIEERLLGLGMPWGLRRVLITLDGASSYFLNAPTLANEIPGFRRRELFWASLPVFPLYVSVLLGYPILSIVSPESVLLRPAQVLFVGWAAPNWIRQACLTFVSSSIHYFGEELETPKQVQVWRRWYLWPVQLFCFNFGATHAIHHFVVEQPFYMRQAIAGTVTPAIRAAGVLLDDIGAFARSNRPPPER